MVVSPASVSIPNDDAFGNTWALTWVAKHLLQPAALFGANMYWPQPHALAFTEGLFAQAAQAAPLLALGASPLLAYNLVLFLTFPLSGLGMYLLARHVSGARAGAFAASLAYAVNPYRLDHLVHLQTLSAQWFPFVILLLLKSLERPRPVRLVLLGALVVAQVSSSGYYAALLALTIAIVLLFHLRAAGWRLVAAVVLAAGVLVLPLFLPYLRVQRQLGLVRTREECVRWSARWNSYIRPDAYSLSPLRPALRFIMPRRDGTPLYPGAVVLLGGLAGLACWRSRPRVRLFLVLGAVGVLLSLGPELRLGRLTLTGPYEILRPLPGFSSLRTPERMFPLALLGLGCASAILLGSRFAARRWVGVAAVVLTVLETVPRRVEGFSAIAPAPAYAQWLAAAPRGPLLELPGEPAGKYLYWSTAHWQPLVNGWGAYCPPESGVLIGVGRRWPLPGAVRTLREAGVRYVGLHTRALAEKQLARLEQTPLPAEVTLVRNDGGHLLYRID